MLTNTQQAMQAAGVNVRAQSNTNAVTIKAASIVVATVPILVVYPCLLYTSGQKSERKFHSVHCHSVMWENIERSACQRK